MCRTPYVRDKNGKIRKKADGDIDWSGVPFPCGQCLHCRINRRRVWTHRIMLERYKCERACYITLTYQDDWLPMTDDGQYNLCKRDVQLFMKRLRKRFPDVKIRYYLCGEYGGLYGRPHYHIALFGLGSNDLSTHLSNRPKYVPRTLLAGHLEEWSILVNGMRESLGNVYIGELTEYSAQYIAGYVTKKLTGSKKTVLNLKTGEEIPPETRQQEFTLMSLKPAIGLSALDDVVMMLQSDLGKKLIEIQNDVPTALKHGSKILPFGRYLSSKLRERLGFDTDENRLKFLAQMIQSNIESKRQGFSSLTDFLLSVDEQKARTVSARHKMFSKR